MTDWNDIKFLELLDKARKADEEGKPDEAKLFREYAQIVNTTDEFDENMEVLDETAY